MRVVILRGEGRLFCAGADLGSVAFAERGAGRAQRQMAMQKLYSGVVEPMRMLSAADHRAGPRRRLRRRLSLALASDVRYAAPNARMNAAYIRVGLGGCDMGAGYLLPRLVGLSNASEFLLSGPLHSTPSARCAWGSSARSSRGQARSKPGSRSPRTC